MNTQVFLDKMVGLLKDELQENLLGVYLHGSLAMGSFNSSKSDIDLLVVIKNPLHTRTNKSMARIIVALHKELSNKGGLEFTIILEKYLLNFVYPTPFEFHYSPYHTEKYETDENYLCGGYEDEDLAAQIVVAFTRGIALYGSPLQDKYPPIARQHYIASILHDIENAKLEIIHNPVYFTLNLCRVLFYLKEGYVSSKKEAGEWGVTTLPEDYQEIVQKCLDAYTDAADQGKLDNQQLLDFADYMLSEIKQLNVKMPNL